LPKYIKRWIEKNIPAYPNVVGWSNVWMPRERIGVLKFKSPVVRIYVVKKISSLILKDEEIIPAFTSVRSWRTLFFKKWFDIDIVEIDLPVAFSGVDKTKNFRPVELGVSVGNEAITAGSLGMLYITKDNKVLAGSNAHVLTDDDPSKTPSQVVRKNILQRGAYHGGKVPDDVVGQYLWHQQIYPIDIPSNCIPSNAIVRFLNWFYEKCGFLTRYHITATDNNTIDFALYTPSVEHVLKIADKSIDPIKSPFIGHLFAGSEQIGIICKIEEILAQAKDYIEKPLSEYTTVKINDVVKGCSFWCNYETVVTDINATVTVGYGTFSAVFTNVILVHNDNIIRGGWSGSGWYKTG
jgi:hypothetical protein